MKVVVVAGGKGTRLGLLGTPKALVPVDGVPLLERTVISAVNQGFTEFLFLVGHLAEDLRAHFGSGARFGAQIEYSLEKEPLGTAGSFKQVARHLSEPFMVVYADIIMDVDFSAFTSFALAHGAAGTLFVHPNDHPFDSDLVEINEGAEIVAFHPKPRCASVPYPNLVSAALYVLTPEALEFVPDEGPSDWGRDVFPSMIGAARLGAYRSCEYVKDVGTPDRLARAELDLRSGKVNRLALRTRKPAVFLDRDGVINVEIDGVHRPEQVRLQSGVANAIKRFNDAGVPVICASNQPALAKGFMSWKDLRDVSAEIDRQLAAEAGAYLDDIRICPHHPEAGWSGEVKELKIDCACRKPKDGLFRDAAMAHNIDLTSSWMVGDRYSDIAAAQSAGVSSILVQTGHAGGDRAQFNCEAEKVCADLASATDVILETIK